MSRAIEEKAGAAYLMRRENVCFLNTCSMQVPALCEQLGEAGSRVHRLQPLKTGVKCELCAFQPCGGGQRLTLPELFLSLATRRKS